MPISMQTDHLAQIPGAVAEWARTLYSDHVDRKDAAGFAAVFTDDATLRFGNSEPLTGRIAIETAIAGFFAAFRSLRHTATRTSLCGNGLFLEAVVTYTRHDGGIVTVPAMTVFDLVESAGLCQATRCLIYVDLTPLFAPTPEI